MIKPQPKKITDWRRKMVYIQMKEEMFTNKKTKENSSYNNIKSL